MRLAPITRAADYLGVSPATVRNYIARSYLTGYRKQGVRGLLVDLDQAEEQLARLPRTKARPARLGRTTHPRYGHVSERAQIRHVVTGEPS